MLDLFSNVKLLHALTPLIRTADAVSTGFDRLNFRSVLHLIQVGITGDTLSGSVFLDVILEHSDSLASGYTAVTDSSHYTGSMVTPASGVVAVINDNAEDDVVVAIEYKGPKRYSRINLDVTGTHTNGMETGVISMGAFPRYIGRNQFSDANVAGT